ncbi:MAG: hypothetical protein ACXACX_13985 [Candidatus Hodarchaeales archaeon]
MLTPVGREAEGRTVFCQKNRTYFNRNFWCKSRERNVMVTSDIGLQNVKYSFSNQISKCTYKNDHAKELIEL